jgi:hypothetical protein
LNDSSPTTLNDAPGLNVPVGPGHVTWAAESDTTATNFVLYSNTIVAIVPNAAKPGDVNHNGHLDSEDVRAMATALYNPYSTIDLSNGEAFSDFYAYDDFNHDGLIDYDDVQRFGQALAAGNGISLDAAFAELSQAIEAEAASHAVPEPVAWILLVSGALMLAYAVARRTQNSQMNESKIA